MVERANNDHKVADPLRAHMKAFSKQIQTRKICISPNLRRRQAKAIEKVAAN